MLNEDARLVRRTMNGDQSAFGALYDRHAPKVFRLLSRLAANRTLAEDLTQDTFVTAYRSLANWQARGMFSSWICGIAIRLYRRQCSQDSHLIVEPLNEEWQQSDVDNDPLDLLTEQEAADRIDAAIQTLPTAYREAFVLLKVDGLKQREVAELLEIPIGTVQSRLGRAVILLRKALKEPDTGMGHLSCPVAEGGTQNAMQFHA